MPRSIGLNDDIAPEAPRSDAEWDAYHAIREAVLFAARGRLGAYKRDHPDDLLPQHHALFLNDAPIGTVRLDDRGDGSGVIRLVAIIPELRGRGYGRRMAAIWEDCARGPGLHTLYVNSAPDAVGFYGKLGWHMHEWNRGELGTAATECIQMRKQL